MKTCIVCLFTLLSFSCSNKKDSSKNQLQPIETNKFYLLVGTYNSETSNGIYVYQFDQESGKPAFISNIKDISNASYLTISADEKFVYAVSEDTGNLALANALSFDKDNGQLKLINSQPTTGDHPCHINVNRERTFITTANYSGGSLSVFPVAEDGSLMPASQVVGFGEPKEVKNPPVSHIHTAEFSPDEKYMFVTDLGKDKIYKFEVHSDPSDFKLFLQQGQPAAFDLEPGSGPRHLAFHPNGKYIYCINELSGKVTAFQYATGNLNEIQSIASDTTTGKGGKGSADIHLTPDGQFLYASNRLKSDGIAIFKVNQEDGKLTSIGYQPTGIHPRNFIISPNSKYLLVANQNSNNIQIFEIEKESGLLKDTQNDVKLDKPVCLKFIQK